VALVGLALSLPMGKKRRSKPLLKLERLFRRRIYIMRSIEKRTNNVAAVTATEGFENEGCLE
jgi:hypothetical protein